MANEPPRPRGAARAALGVFARISGLLAAATAWAGPPPSPSAGPPRVEIAGGRFTPLFGLDKGQVDVEVRRFAMDRNLVTNADFEEFTKKSRDWRKGRASALFADTGYLSHWKRGALGKAQRRQPVVFVSWHAARAYCEAKGGRLPYVNEWELAAAADETKPYALKDPEFTKKILAWYSTPSGARPLGEVGASKPNYHGVQDLHGLVWEWTEDFNSVFVSGDNRQDGDKLKEFVCGNGAIDAANREDYAAFMRYAMRSSLKADHTTANLGFRCAYDVLEEKKP